MAATDSKVWQNGYKSGWCISGCHEGVVKKSPSGKEFPSCPGGGCTCYCHNALADIAAAIASIASETGVSVPVPSTVPDAPTDVPRTPKESVVTMHSPGTDITEDHPVNVVSPPIRLGPPKSTVLLAAVIPFRLSNGRRAPGSLDREIEHLLRNARPSDPVTPMVVGEILGASPGAVSAVWARWERVGKCELAKKPARFVRFLK